MGKGQERAGAYVFGILVILLVAGYAMLLLYVALPLFTKVLIALGAVGFAAAMLYVIIQRSKEIDQEDRDDISKY